MNLPPLDWSHLAAEIPSQGLKCEKVVPEKDRAGIALALGLQELKSLVATYRIVAAGAGYRLTGYLDAGVVQACIVSLEPLESHLREDFEAEFRSADDGAESGEDKTVLEGLDIEPIQHGRIDAGRVILETLSGALDPYPRKEGAAFTWRDPAEDQAAKASPFAVLSQLKDKK